MVRPLRRRRPEPDLFAPVEERAQRQHQNDRRAAHPLITGAISGRGELGRGPGVQLIERFAVRGDPVPQLAHLGPFI